MGSGGREANPFIVASAKLNKEIMALLDVKFGIPNLL